VSLSVSLDLSDLSLSLPLRPLPPVSLSPCLSAGVIDLKEFLFTMLAFQPEEDLPVDDPLGSSDLPPASDLDLQTIRMFFQFFDFHGSGCIQLDDFKLAVSCLLENRQQQSNGLHSLASSAMAAAVAPCSSSSQDFNEIFFAASTSSHGSLSFPSSHATVENIEELFLAIDTDKNGMIGFAEFREFYLALLATTSQTGVPLS
jgi:Ca2+-binding EF-hand superfamily protein